MSKSICLPPPGNRDPGVRPRALPWYRRWLRAPPALPTQADVLQIHVDAPGGSAFLLEPGLGTLVVGMVHDILPGLSSWFCYHLCAAFAKTQGGT